MTERPGPRPVLAITGPTASGKTALSLPVARALGGEIVSVDSRQVYRGMDVGTAKLPEAERGGIPHHGLDLVEPDERYSAGRFARDAGRWIAGIERRGRLPLLVGGTGFFLRALLEPIFREPEMEPGRRERLRRWMSGQPREELGRWAAVLDPDRAELARAGGRQRLSRTLEIALLTGRPLSWWHRSAPPEGPPVQARIALLTLPRDVLYRRIDERAEVMFREGLLEEVRRLLEAGFRPWDPGMTGTGYREAAAVLEGRLSSEEGLERMRSVTRSYARRQLTWFRNQLPAGVLEVDATAPLDRQVEAVLAWWKRTGSGDGG